MKKIYMIPETEVVELEERLPLLAGSDVNSNIIDDNPIDDPSHII